MCEYVYKYVCIILRAYTVICIVEVYKCMDIIGVHMCSSTECACMCKSMYHIIHAYKYLHINTHR